MIKRMICAAGAIASLGGLAMAQQPAGLSDADFALLDALPLEQMCGPKVGNGLAFGNTDLPPSGFNIPGMDKQDAPPSARPFTTLALDATRWSNRFYKATFEMPARKADAPRVIERLARHFRAQGWIEKKGTDDDDDDDGGTLIDPTPSAGDVNFYSGPAAMNGASRSGVRVALSYALGNVSLECTDMALMLVHAEEAFGDPPADMPRPLPPKTPRPAALEPAICATPAGRSEIDTLFGSRRPGALVRYAGERNNYGDRLIAWKSGRLKRSGKVSEQRMLNLMMSGMAAGSPKGNPLAAFELFAKIIDQAVEAGKRGEAGDAQGECQAAVALLKSLDAIDRINGGQWRAMDQALDTEARRVGVSWD